MLRMQFVCDVLGSYDAHISGVANGCVATRTGTVGGKLQPYTFTCSAKSDLPNYFYAKQQLLVLCMPQ